MANRIIHDHVSHPRIPLAWATQAGCLDTRRLWRERNLGHRRPTEFVGGVWRFSLSASWLVVAQPHVAERATTPNAFTRLRRRFYDAQAFVIHR